jgi:hypothetical protein
MAPRCWVILVALPAAHGWCTAPQTPLPACPRARLSLLELAELASSGGASGAATGEDVAKTDGIPNYMIRTAGRVARIAEGSDSAAVLDDGVLYESDRLVSIVTSDVIEMVQQQGGAAEKLDYLGENLLVDGLLFDDFRVDDTFEVASPDGGEAVRLEIVAARPSSAMELGQLGDDQSKRQSIAAIGGLAPGCSGWQAKVVGAGRVRAGFDIVQLTKAAKA